MIRFSEVRADDAQLILNWRTSPRVTKFMNTDIPYDLAAQNKWLSTCYSKAHYYHWLIKADDVPIGLLYISDYDETASRASWGFYIGDERYSDYGGFVPPYFYNFLFDSLGLCEVVAEVFYNNLNVIGLHQLHGYEFNPSGDRVIVKNGRDILLVSMMLAVEKWRALKRFKKSIAHFPTSLWEARPALLR